MLIKSSLLQVANLLLYASSYTHINDGLGVDWHKA